MIFRMTQFSRYACGNWNKGWLNSLTMSRQHVQETTSLKYEIMLLLDIIVLMYSFGVDMGFSQHPRAFDQAKIFFDSCGKSSKILHKYFWPKQTVVTCFFRTRLETHI